MRVAVPITLPKEERRQLLKLSKGRSRPARMVLRAKIVLQAAAGRQNKEIAEYLDRCKRLSGPGETDSLISGLPASRMMRKARVDRRRWTLRRSLRSFESRRGKPLRTRRFGHGDMAKLIGVSAATIRRVWAAHGLTPHLFRTFKVSRDPDFVEKLEDVVGLYLSPPANAIVLS